MFMQNLNVKSGICFFLSKMRRAGGFVVKAIDMDISFFERSLQDIAIGEQNNSCSSDEDCNFIGCSIKCNMRTKGCTGVLASNNLRVSK